MGLFSSEKKQERKYYSSSDVLDATYENAHKNNNMICVIYDDVKMLLDQNKELLKQNQEMMKRIERLEREARPEYSSSLEAIQSPC